MSGGPDTMSPSASLIQGMQSLSRYLPAQSLSITRTRYIASSRKWPRKVLSDPAVAHRVPLPCMYPKTMGKLEYVWILCSSKSYEERFIPSPKSCWSPAEDEQQESVLKDRSEKCLLAIPQAAISLTYLVEPRPHVSVGLSSVLFPFLSPPKVVWCSSAH